MTSHMQVKLEQLFQRQDPIMSDHQARNKPIDVLVFPCIGRGGNRNKGHYQETVVHFLMAK